MEGFGSSDFVTPLAYGSVQDGLTTNQGIEHVLKRTYWKTKQTVIKKLKKPEDSFVVAGDSDIDAKLEVCYNSTMTLNLYTVAYHIQWTICSCVGYPLYITGCACMIDAGYKILIMCNHFEVSQRISILKVKICMLGVLGYTQKC